MQPHGAPLLQLIGSGPRRARVDQASHDGVVDPPTRPVGCDRQGTPAPDPNSIPSWRTVVIARKSRSTRCPAVWARSAPTWLPTKLGRQQLRSPALNLLPLGRRCSPMPRPGRCAPGSRGRPVNRRTNTTRSQGRGRRVGSRPAVDTSQASDRARRRARSGWIPHPRDRDCDPT